MNFSLPQLKGLANPEFSMTYSRDKLDVSNARNLLFLKEEESYFFFDKMAGTWEKAGLIDSESTIESALKKLESDAKVLVMEKGVPLGFLDARLLCEAMLRSYRRLEAFYETVINTMDASVTVIDQEERVCTWTDGAERIFSLERNNIIGKKIGEFFDDDKLLILKTLKEGKRLIREQHQPRSDLFVLINANPVYLEDEIIGAVVSESDITSQVLLNEELFNMSSEVHRLQKEVAKLQPLQDPFKMIKGRSEGLKKTIDIAKKVCTVQSTVLILGESGVGKEVFANAIHEAREEANAPFIPINCGAIPPSLFESELFGYEKGAFSGADVKGKKGKIELARGGTLFLDEIGEMPLEMQVKLLRVLQEKKFYRVGGVKEIDVDCRIVAATNRDLKKLIEEKQFREDLFYRLNVVSLYIPPLRERQEDIIELTHYFLNEFSIRYNRPIHGISQDIMQELLHHQWEGNIRELRNVVERLVVFATDGIIRKEYLPFQNGEVKGNVMIHTQTAEAASEDILPLEEELNHYERTIIEKALKLYGGNKVLCAAKLGVTRATLYNRMKKLNIAY